MRRSPSLDLLTLPLSLRRANFCACSQGLLVAGHASTCLVRGKCFTTSRRHYNHHHCQLHIVEITNRDFSAKQQSSLAQCLRQRSANTRLPFRQENHETSPSRLSQQRQLLGRSLHKNQLRYVQVPPQLSMAQILLSLALTRTL